MLSCDRRSCLLQMSLERRQIALTSSGFFCLLLAIAGTPVVKRSQPRTSLCSISHGWLSFSLCTTRSAPSSYLLLYCPPSECMDWCGSLLTRCCWPGSTSRLLQEEYCSPELIACNSQEERDMLAVDCDPCWRPYEDISFDSNTRQMLA